MAVNCYFRSRFRRNGNQRSRESWPYLPGILKALAGEYFPVSLCVCAAAILGFFLWLILNIRKLTNDLCRMLCLGVLGGFLIQTLYSLACLAGLGPYEYVFFPLLSVWYSGMGAIHSYHYWFLGIFLNCHKSEDRKSVV